MTQPLQAPYCQFINSNGAPLTGGKVYTYSAGTTTPKNSYTDSTASTANSNPVVLDSAGRASIWLNGSYYIEVKDSSGTLIWSVDNVSGTLNGGDMSSSVYDPSNVKEQLLGISSVQTFTNKSTSTTPTTNTAGNAVANMTAVQSSQIGGFVNKSRNGAALDVWQRGTSGTITAGTNAITADGIYLQCTGANCTWSRSSGLSGSAYSSYSLTITGNTSLSDAYIFERIESVEAAKLYNGGASITIQFLLLNSTGSSLTPVLSVAAPTATDNYTSTTSVLGNTNLQTCPDGVVTKCSYTFTPTSAITKGLQYAIDFGSNLTSGTRSVVIGNIDIRSTPGVSVGLNSNPPAVEYRNVAANLALCQRYYQTYNALYGGGYSASGAAVYMSPVIYPVQMRATPTATISGATYTNASAYSALNITASLYTPAITVTAAGNYAYFGAIVTLNAEL
jgi:hypothetical protein